MRSAAAAKSAVQRRIWQRRRQPAAAALDEAGAAAGDIDQLADQVGVGARHEIIQIEVDVFDAAAELGGEVVAQRLGRQPLQIALRGDEGAARLGHLLAVDGQEAVREYRRRAAVAGAMQHRRPEQRVEVADVLADEVIQLGGSSRISSTRRTRRRASARQASKLAM